MSAGLQVVWRRFNVGERVDEALPQKRAGGLRIEPNGFRCGPIGGLYEVVFAPQQSTIPTYHNQAQIIAF